MASDFYSILKGSIDSRALKTSGERREVYDQARRAMIRKLWSSEPPLADDEIAKRIGFFDAAVERIEGDFEPDPEPAEPAAPAGRVYEGYDEEADYRTVSDHRRNGAAPPPPIEATLPPPRPEFRRNAPPPGPAPEAAGGDEEPIPSIFRRGDPPGIPVDDLPEDESGHDGFGQLDEGFEGHGRFKPSIRLKLRLPTGERDRVRLLAAVVACLAVGLIAILAFALYPQQSPVPAAAAPATAAVKTRVSDAATAAEIPKRAVDVARSFTVFDGGDPTVFVGTPDNPIRFDRDKNGPFTRVSSSSDAAGARAVIGPGLAASLAGRKVRVTMSVRSSREGGAERLRFAYQAGVATSHWQVADAPAMFGEVGLIWRVPSQRSDPGGDYLLIEPGIPGDGTGVDIRSIRIDVIGPS